MTICCRSLVVEGEANEAVGYDGGELLRCSRCALTYYKGKASQKAHWPVHKLSCRPITEKQKQCIDNMSLEEATEYLNDIISKIGGGNDTVYAMKHIRKLMDQDVPDPTEVEMMLHGLCRCLIFYPDNLFHYAFYARPGVSDYLLTNNQEDLLNPRTRLIKTKLDMYNGIPSESYIEFCITDEAENERIHAVQEEYRELDEDWTNTASEKFCYLYFNVLVAAAVRREESIVSFHDGCGVLRSGRLNKFPKLNCQTLAVAALR